MNDISHDAPIVLVVDDTATNIGIIGACLRDKFRVKVATRGEQCLKIASTEPQPDLILLDIEMPEMDGYEVCRRLKDQQDTKHIPVIFVTGRLGDKNEEYGLNLGAVDYITKPISPAIVLARVTTQINLKLARDKLRQMALFDQLTGLHNRHFLLRAAAEKIARARRHLHPMSMLMLDIDHFKHINDNHGHPVGDIVIKSVADLLKANCRAEDIAARIGGEEFVILLDHCDAASACDKAEHLRKELENLRPKNIDVTVSIGISELLPGEEELDGWLKRSDDALYEAKNNGRNQVVHHR